MINNKDRYPQNGDRQLSFLEADGAAIPPQAVIGSMATSNTLNKVTGNSGHPQPPGDYMGQGRSSAANVAQKNFDTNLIKRQAREK